MTGTRATRKALHVAELRIVHERSAPPEACWIQ
jgi:hypothetical protein